MVAISGELVHANMGVSEEDLETIRSTVSIVLHVAATIKFNEKIKMAVKLNIVAVRHMLALARQLKSCKAIVHVSTAYAHTTRDLCEEVVYPPDFDVSDFIAFIDKLEPAAAERLTPALVGQRPNTYTLTKSLAEYLVAVEGRGLPVTIVRPSIVFSAWHEPFPGWIDNFNGPAGLSLAVGTGVLRICPANPNTVADVVPVDGVSNFILASAWYISRQYNACPSIDVPVFNYTSSRKNPATWGEWSIMLPEIWKKYPLERRVFRRPSLYLASPNTLTYNVLVYFCHELPARLSDWSLRLQGRKPRMVGAYGKLGRALREYIFFMHNDWKWDCHRVDEVNEAMSPADRQKFFFDLRDLHWRTYLEQSLVGVKKFLMREDMSRVEVARQAQKKYVQHEENERMR